MELKQIIKEFKDEGLYHWMKTVEGDRGDGRWVRESIIDLDKIANYFIDKFKEYSEKLKVQQN